MLKQRVITASILTAIFLLLLFVAPLAFFTLFVAVVVALAGWEWANLSGLQGSVPRVLYAALIVIAGAALSYVVLETTVIALDNLLLVSGLWWAIALLWVQSYPASAVLWRPVAIRGAMGFVVLLPTMVALYALRAMPNGEFLVLAVVLLVAAADIGAYFAGRAFGKRKLAPRVSPGKTWAGAVGGVVAVAVIAVIYGLLTQASISLSLAVALPTAVASILGDLFESMLKRQRGVKDSSQLLPGHGGVLDRIDGLVAAAPIFALAVVSTGWLL